MRETTTVGPCQSCRHPRVEGAAEVGQSLCKPAAGCAGLGRCNKCHFGIGNRRKAIALAQHRMLGKNGDLGQDADAESRRDSGLNAENTRARVGDLPGPTHRLQRMDRPIAVKASLLEYGERQWLPAEIDGATAAGDPVQTLGPGGNAASLFRIAFEQRKVDLAALERASHAIALSAPHVEV